MSADPCISLLRDLVSIDSVNPTLVPGARGEGEIADAVAEYMRRLRLDVHVQQAAPGRPNVIGVLDGRQPGPSLMFCGHLDTVGVEGMSSPFDPVERNGRIYGRGSQDMKGGVAAMIDAARLAIARGFTRGRLIVAAVVDEEYASLGADALVTAWRSDAAVVTEPTDLQIGIAHKGFAWLEIETRGVAAHGSRPSDGVDAIMRMGRLLSRLERLDTALQSRAPHAIVGTGSLHASTVNGGREWSSYPERCRLELERRTVPGERATDAAAEVHAIIAGLRDEDPSFLASSKLVFARPPYEVSRESPIVAAMSKAACRTVPVPVPPLAGMSFWTDAAILGGAGIPCLLFGPGGHGLHSTEEYVRIADVLTSRDVLAALIEDWMT
jgi:acetylornithine deacetylase